MPYSKKRKFKPKGEYNKSKKFKRGSRKKTAIVRLPSFGFPDQAQTKLTFATSYTMTSTSGSVAFQQFRVNSVYDPDYTGVGHQPLYFDEMAALYNKYRVRGVAYEIDVVNVDGSIPGIFCVVPDDTAAVPTTCYEALELGKCKHTVVAADQGQNRGKVTGYVAAKSIFGVKDLGQAIEYEAYTNANPGNVCYLTLLWQSQNQSSTSACNITIRLTYYVDFFSKKIVSPSLKSKEEKIMEEIKRFNIQKEKELKKFVPSSPMREN